MYYCSDWLLSRDKRDRDIRDKEDMSPVLLILKGQKFTSKMS
jgi:hypothetical protein